MDIKFTDNKAGHHNTDIKVLMWKLYVKEFNKNIIIYYAAGALFLIVGLFSTVNLSICFGFAWLVMTTFNYIGLARQKGTYLQRLHDTNVSYFGKSNWQTIEINDNGIKYQSEEFRYETNWPIITHYKIIGNYIFLIPTETFVSALVVDKRFITTEESEELLNFLQTNKKVMTKITF